MLRRKANAAGVASIALLAILTANDLQAAVGGPQMPRWTQALLTIAIVVLANIYWVYRVTEHVTEHIAPKPAYTPEQFRDLVRTAVTEIIRANTQVEASAIALEIKKAIGDIFHGDLEAVVAEIYRVGMASGAERVSRRHLVPIREDGN